MTIILRKKIILAQILLCASPSIAQNTAQRGKENASVQQIYQQGVAQSRSDPADSAVLRRHVAQTDSKAKSGPPIPKELWGRWIIRTDLPTRGVTCWDEKQAQTLVATELEYGAGIFTWKHKSMRNLGTKTGMVEAQEFAQENSGSGGSVHFSDLGITEPVVKQVEIHHPDAKVFLKSMDCCGAVPGETVLIKGPNALILNLCGVFYEASRADGAEN